MRKLVFFLNGGLNRQNLRKFSFNLYNFFSQHYNIVIILYKKLFTIEYFQGGEKFSLRSTIILKIINIETFLSKILSHTFCKSKVAPFYSLARLFDYIPFAHNNHFAPSLSLNAETRYNSVFFFLPFYYSVASFFYFDM